MLATTADKAVAAEPMVVAAELMVFAMKSPRGKRIAPPTEKLVNTCPFLVLLLSSMLFWRSVEGRRSESKEGHEK